MQAKMEVRRRMESKEVFQARIWKSAPAKGHKAYYTEDTKEEERNTSDLKTAFKSYIYLEPALAEIVCMKVTKKNKPATEPPKAEAFARTLAPAWALVLFGDGKFLYFTFNFRFISVQFKESNHSKEKDRKYICDKPRHY